MKNTVVFQNLEPPGIYDNLKYEYDEDMDMCNDPDCLTCEHRRELMDALGTKNGPWIPSPDEVEAFRTFGEPEAATHQTLVIIKPDAIRRRIVSKVIKRLEATDLRCIFMEMKILTCDEAEGLYNEHQDESFYGNLISFMTSERSIVMVWEGQNAAHKIRELIGNKHPSESPAGTIRGDLGGEYPETIIHGSDPWSAKREVEIFYECS